MLQKSSLSTTYSQMRCTETASIDSEETDSQIHQYRPLRYHALVSIHVVPAIGKYSLVYL